jgi:hypothetical protein
MSNENNDPSKQVLVWDCSGDKKLKMSIGELYDKVGMLRQYLSCPFSSTERTHPGCENVKEKPIPKKGRVSFKGAIFDMPMLLRIQRIFGQWQTLYIVGAA